jgi:hypothetical protein
MLSSTGASLAELSRTDRWTTRENSQSIVSFVALDLASWVDMAGVWIVRMMLIVARRLELTVSSCFSSSTRPGPSPVRQRPRLILLRHQT